MEVLRMRLGRGENLLIEYVVHGDRRLPVVDRVHPAIAQPGGPRLTTEVDVNSKDPSIDRHRQRTDSVKDLENEQVVAEDVSVHRAHTLGPSAVEERRSQPGSDASALPRVRYQYGQVDVPVARTPRLATPT